MSITFFLHPPSYHSLHLTLTNKMYSISCIYCLFSWETCTSMNGTFYIGVLIANATLYLMATLTGLCTANALAKQDWSLMSVRRTSFKDSSTYRSVFTACLLFGDWAYVDVLTSITLLSPEWFLGFLLSAIGYISVDNFANFGHRAAPFSASL